MKLTAQGANSLRGVFDTLADSEFYGAVAQAMTWTANDAHKAAQAEMRTVFDRPTAYALGSLFVVGATAEKLVAEVDVKDGAAYFMRPQTEGGGRKSMKRVEQTLRAMGVLPGGWYVVPGAGASLDRNGNMQPGQVTQILSQLRVQLVGGFDRSMSRDARKQINAQRKAGGRFYVRKVGQGAAPGVYQREFIGRNSTPVLVFVRTARYRQRLPLAALAQRTVDQRLEAHAFRALAKAVQRINQAGAQRALF